MTDSTGKNDHPPGFKEALDEAEQKLGYRPEVKNPASWLRGWMQAKRRLEQKTRRKK